MEVLEAKERMTMPTEEREQERDKKLLSLRLPTEAYQRVVAQAEKERRSIHNMLLILIEEALQQREAV
jgi:hypothetical protein